jgi:hypothetical protein
LLATTGSPSWALLHLLWMALAISHALVHGLFFTAAINSAHDNAVAGFALLAAPLAVLAVAAHDVARSSISVSDSSTWACI